jgi:hypothetical protein
MAGGDGTAFVMISKDDASPATEGFFGCSLVAGVLAEPSRKFWDAFTLIIS